MPRILHNNFSLDKQLLRRTRLDKIEHFIDELQPELNLPPELLAWAQTCKTRYYDAAFDADFKKGQKQGAFANVRYEDADLLKVYGTVRAMALGLYHGHDDYFGDYHFDKPFPRARAARIDQSEHVIEVAQRHRDEGLPFALPATVTDKLQLAVDELNSAVADADKKKYDYEHAALAAREIFNADTPKLRQLRSWALLVWSKFDRNFKSIGMAISKKRRAGYPPQVENLSVTQDCDTVKISWDETPRAVSYEIEWSPDSKDWDELHDTRATSYSYKPPPEKRYYRVRAHNLRGFGDWSETVTV